jgi:hypothetical protein
MIFHIFQWEKFVYFLNKNQDFISRSEYTAQILQVL